MLSEVLVQYTRVTVVLMFRPARGRVASGWLVRGGAKVVGTIGHKSKGDFSEAGDNLR